MNLITYDPTDFDFKILDGYTGLEIPIYGFSSKDKITFNEDSLSFHLQSTSGCVNNLLDYLGCNVSIRLETKDPNFTKLLNLFDEKFGTLVLEKGSLISSDIPELSFKIKWVA